MTTHPDHFWRRGPLDNQSVPSNHYHNLLIDVSVIITFLGYIRTAHLQLNTLEEGVSEDLRGVQFSEITRSSIMKDN